MSDPVEPIARASAPAPAVGWAVATRDASHLLRFRQSAGLVLAPLAFAVVLALPFPTLAPSAHRLAAVMAAVIVLWITEALPLPVTALGAATACVVLRIAPAGQVFQSFADPLIFLFIGSFWLGHYSYMVSIGGWHSEFCRCLGLVPVRAGCFSPSAPLQRSCRFGSPTQPLPR